MQPLVERGGVQPEAKIQKSIIQYLEDRGWFCKVSIGNIQVQGWPDLYVTHKRYGPRWVEVKCPNRYKIQPSQYETFGQFCRNGTGVWILTGGNEIEYNKLFSYFNWHTYIPLTKDPERTELKAEMQKLVTPKAKT